MRWCGQSSRATWSSSEARTAVRCAARSRSYAAFGSSSGTLHSLPVSVGRVLLRCRGSRSFDPGRTAVAITDRRNSGGFPVLVVPVPPLVWWGLRVALGRVLPLLLTTEGGHVEIAPGASHDLVAATVDEVRAKHAVAVADERVRAVPLVHSEVGVEAVGDRVPRHRPAHARFHPGDVGL